MGEEWADTKYVCDGCWYDGPGKFVYIRLKKWPYICLCEDCIKEMQVENE